jgi:hypothetical protein
MTRIFTRTLQAGLRRAFALGNPIVLVFGGHVRLVVGVLAMALVITALCAPLAVQSISPPFIDAPTNLAVTGTLNTGITLSWTGSAGAHHYLVERSESMSGPFVFIDLAFSPSYNDAAISSLHAYVYRVRTVDSAGAYSTPSNIALGTAITFEFSQLQGPQFNPLPRQRIKAQHFHDVRTAINAVRAVANMPAAIWARDTLNNLEIKASDVQELRNRLDEALTVLQIPVLLYQDPVLSTGANGTPIRGNHLEQLQARSTRGSSNSSGPLYSSAGRAVAGEFGPIIQLPLVAVHLSVLPDRRVLFWGRDFATDANGTILPTPNGEAKQVTGKSEAYVWNLTTDERLRVANSTTNLFCSGHSFLPDGSLFVSGGHAHADYDAVGEKQTNIFNYHNNSWTLGPDMNQARWYPYNVTLGTGEPLIMAGSYWSNPPTLPPTAAVNLVPQVYTPAPEVRVPLRDLSAPPQNRLTVYPYLHLLSDGKVFQAQSGFFSNQVEKQSRSLDPVAKANQWTELQSTLFPHAMGSSVFLGDDKILLVGGFSNGSVPTKEAEVMNYSPGSASWRQVTSMKFARTYHTTTILPDGKVLVTGGVSCPGPNNIESYDGLGVKCSGGQVMNAELWDPLSEQWTTMAAQKEIRAYHSIAALLPDGRVLVGGGGLPGTVGETGIYGSLIVDREIRKPNAMGLGHNNVEIYSPPYLFDSNGNPAARPLITSVPPPSATYGETFFVGTSGTGSQPKVSLVRLSSVTHGFNQDQRQIFLDNVVTGGGLLVTAPTSSNKCPPGYYMLFVLNAVGVPSVAEIIRVQNTSLFPTDVPQTTASGAGSTWEQGIEFSSTVDGQITHIRFWKAVGEPSGGHVGHIWDAATGMELASVQFFNETASGWQETQLPTPLSITAGARYKVTYNVYSVVAKTFDVFCDPPPMVCNPTPITRGPLVGWGSSYSTPAGSFPTTGSTSNLFADVRFK